MEGGGGDTTRARGITELASKNSPPQDSDSAGSYGQACPLPYFKVVDRK